MPTNKSAEIKVIIFDVDGTLTEPKSSWKFVHEQLGIWESKGKEILDRYLENKINYQEFCDADAKAWSEINGVDVIHIRDILKKAAYTPAAKEVVRELRDRGYDIFLISSGLDILVERIAKECRIDKSHWWANGLEHINGKLTGHTIIKINDKSKENALKLIQNNFNIKSENIAVIGDSSGDIPLFKKCAIAFAFRPENDEVIRSAQNNVLDNLSDLLDLLDSKDNEIRRYHLWTVWHPGRDFSDRSIKETQNIIEKDGKVWWGTIHDEAYQPGIHINKSERLPKIIQRMDNNFDVRCWLYCLDPIRTEFYFGNVKRIIYKEIDRNKIDSIEDEFKPRPDYYNDTLKKNKRYRITYWFEMDEIKKVDINYMKHLRLKHPLHLDEYAPYKFPQIVEECEPYWKWQCNQIIKKLSIKTKAADVADLSTKTSKLFKVTKERLKENDSVLKKLKSENAFDLFVSSEFLNDKEISILFSETPDQSMRILGYIKAIEEEFHIRFDDKLRNIAMDPTFKLFHDGINGFDWEKLIQGFEGVEDSIYHKTTVTDVINIFDGISSMNKKTSFYCRLCSMALIFYLFGRKNPVSSIQHDKRLKNEIKNLSNLLGFTGNEKEIDYRLFELQKDLKYLNFKRNSYFHREPLKPQQVDELVKTIREKARRCLETFIFLSK